MLFRSGKKFARIEGAPGGSGVWADFDGDGDPDFFALVGQLYRNEKGKTFTVVEKAIPELPTKVCLGAVPGDFDGDGDLDLYVGGYETWQVANYHDVILTNKGDGTFAETWRSGATQPARGITAADFDEDGDLDIYVSNYRLVANRHWQNDGKGAFADVTAAFGTAGDGGLGAWGHTIGSAWGDFDNDGDEDLFFTYVGLSNRLYENAGDGTFRDVTESVSLKSGNQITHEAVWFDVDNDGYLDVYTGNFGDWLAGDSPTLGRTNSHPPPNHLHPHRRLTRLPRGPAPSVSPWSLRSQYSYLEGHL